MNIDYNRGVIKKINPQGVAIFMYRDDPGIFLSAFGTPVTDDLAATAGFAIERLSKARLKKERLKVAAQEVERQLADEEKARNTIVRTEKGFSIVDIGLGRFNVRDPDGNVLTVAPLSRELAEGLLSGLTGTVTAPEAPKAQRPAPVNSPASPGAAKPRIVPLSDIAT